MALKKMDLKKIAAEISKNTGSEALEDPESPGFTRFMMYSCLFFHASGQCGGVPCSECRATKVIEQGVKKHPELTPEYEMLKEVEGRRHDESADRFSEHESVEKKEGAVK